MTDILVRNVPDDVVAAIDVNARTAGISRAEYLRRLLERERAAVGGEVTVASLRRFSQRCGDLADPDVMRSAWS
ncbi:MAG: ribbon-helix-helix protein, CopG family [bacterium]|nr:ribbon-helix-helix protein, CopG family [bacterium]MCY3923980.1 ribbon-helix-helix protein, CopG family [bacterium]